MHIYHNLKSDLILESLAVNEDQSLGHFTAAFAAVAAGIDEIESLSADGLKACGHYTCGQGGEPIVRQVIGGAVDRLKTCEHLALYCRRGIGAGKIVSIVFAAALDDLETCEHLALVRGGVLEIIGVGEVKSMLGPVYGD